MNTKTKKAITPWSPIKALMVYGITKPALTSAAVNSPRKVGTTGVLWMARAAKPMTVPRPHGIQKIARAARLYPGTVALTSVANDFCQNVVSITTRARFPSFRSNPQMMASRDFIVRSNPL